MARPEIKTTVIADGLRYKSKTPGSPFKAASSFGGATMSSPVGVLLQPDAAANDATW